MFKVVGSPTFKDGQLIIPKQKVKRPQKNRKRGEFTYRSNGKTYCKSCDKDLITEPGAMCTEPRHMERYEARKKYIQEMRNGPNTS